MKKKRVYILGAGSSIGHSNGIYPSITGFFNKAKEFDLPELKTLNESISKFIGIDLYNQADKLDIEKIATLIEIEIERNPSANNIAVRERLLSLIQKVLMKTSLQIKNTNGEFHLLKQKLEESDTVLTFNWDLLLDSVLDREVILKEWYAQKGNRDKIKGLYNNFITFISDLGQDSYRRISLSTPYQEWNGDIGYLLKLHGSVDWFYCANEHCRAYSKVFPLLDTDSMSYCGECHESVQRLLIPPVLNKAYRQYPLIRKIWNLAIKEISIADEIIIWGYSLPPTDFYAYWLLKHGHKSCNKIILINPMVVRRKKDKVNNAFVKRFKEIFPDSNFALFEDFNDFHKGSDIYKKFKIPK
jgi:hypothetical protein